MCFFADGNDHVGERLLPCSPPGFVESIWLQLPEGRDVVLSAELKFPWKAAAGFAGGGGSFAHQVASPFTTLSGSRARGACKLGFCNILRCRSQPGRIVREIAPLSNTSVCGTPRVGTGGGGAYDEKLSRRIADVARWQYPDGHWGGRLPRKPGCVSQGVRRGGSSCVCPTFATIGNAIDVDLFRRRACKQVEVATAQSETPFAVWRSSGRATSAPRC